MQEEWYTLIELAKIAKFPFQVHYRVNGSLDPKHIVHITFTHQDASGQFIPRHDPQDGHYDRANKRHYRLTDARLYRSCSCDWRNVILVTGCRCGKGV